MKQELIKKIKEAYRFIFKPTKIAVKETYGVGLLPCPVCNELPVATARVRKDGRADILLSCRGKHIRLYESSHIITGMKPLDVDKFIASSLKEWNRLVEEKNNEANDE